MLVIKTLILFTFFISVALVIGYRLLIVFNLTKTLNRIETVVFSFALGDGLYIVSGLYSRSVPYFIS